MNYHIINGEEVNPTQEQIQKMEENKKDSTSICILPNGSLVFSVGETRPRREWIVRDFGVDLRTFESLVCGYISREMNKIHVFVSSHYKEAPIELFDDETVTELLYLAHSLYGMKKPRIYNGCIVGEVGEVWPPISEIEVADDVWGKLFCF